MKKHWTILAALFVTGCSTRQVAPAAGGPAARVTGTIAYRERIALPPDAGVPDPR
jgi:uncharacterized lipoprotein YbaY